MEDTGKRRKKRAVKTIAILFVLYIGMVVAFESMLGFFQPADQSTMVVTTMEADGTAHDRVVARLESGGQLFVAVNHWPRAWYRRTLENPNVQVTLDGDRGDYLAVRTADEEYDRVNDEHGIGFVFRFLTGFPRRHILRLDPR
jgi:hypothetical protein